MILYEVKSDEVLDDSNTTHTHTHTTNFTRWRRGGARQGQELRNCSLKSDGLCATLLIGQRQGQRQVQGRFLFASIFFYAL